MLHIKIQYFLKYTYTTIAYFGTLKDIAHFAKSKTCMGDKGDVSLTPFKISNKIDHLLKEIILKDEFDV